MVISINRIDLVDEIGCWIAEETQGRGLMTRSTEKVIEFGFIEFKLNRIEIRVFLECKLSEVAAKRLGFVRED
ncbi:GNAT family N-acetyltransferase [Microbulbifer sp. ZKSA002]|uniref:GNAT family N-acetyltransferase n=1 Tax=Microbulbifer sp. ZKSA002 TaxID=3243388 RepID=UPI00403A3332